MPLRSCTAQKK